MSCYNEGSAARLTLFHAIDVMQTLVKIRAAHEVMALGTDVFATLVLQPGAAIGAEIPESGRFFARVGVGVGRSSGAKRRVFRF